jgi:hypothetical protein
MNRLQILHWRGGLAIGRALKTCGRTISELGWRIEDRAALYYDRHADRAIASILAMSDEDVLRNVSPDEIERTRRIIDANTQR